MARGLRNNNPLNIRKSSDKWQGLCEQQTDKEFFQFTTMAFGYRAAFKTIRTYMTKYKCNTLAKIIQRWAPPEDKNNTNAYIRTVSEKSGIYKDLVLYFTNKEDMCKLVAAMSLVENGIPAKLEEVRNGYDLAGL